MDELQVSTTAVDGPAYGLIRPRWLDLSLAVLFLLTNLLVTDIASRFADRVGIFHSSHWNWFGKITSIALSCIVLVLSPSLRQNIGLRWRQASASARLSVSCFIAFVGCAIGIGFLIPPIMFSADTLLYQFFIPAIDEELIFRGILLAM